MTESPNKEQVTDNMNLSHKASFSTLPQHQYSHILTIVLQL